MTVNGKQQFIVDLINGVGLMHFIEVLHVDGLQ